MVRYRFDLEDTIAAISSPLGQAGIGIIRISGKDSLKIADKIFISKDKKSPSEFKTYTVHYGFIVDPSKSRIKDKTSLRDKEVIDEVLLTVMRAPKSYTKEDVVEISSHGSIVSMKRILDSALYSGARLAEPGEFTKRAFLNGRIDLTQAEAVLDIINAKTDASLKIAINHLEGDLSKKIKKIRLQLIDILSSVEASIDFTQEDIEPIDIDILRKRIKKVLSDLKKLLDSSDQGIILNEGITTVICGKTNVGKSSLMNSLIKKEKVIVTPLAGTTRDAIEELINLKGIPLRIVDTAGILKPTDVVEKESITRSKKYLKTADIVILILDNNSPIDKEDKDVIKHIKGKKIIIAINKIDLPTKIDLDRIRSFLKKKKIVKISALKGTNLDKLEKAITDTVFRGEILSTSELIVNNIRHKAAIRDAYNNLKKGLSAVDESLSIEFIAEDLKETVKNLERITGQTTPDDILDRIFSKFCIGK